MNYEEIVKTDKQFYMNTFGDRTPVSFSYGKGIKLYSTDHSEYTDLMSGIAVSAIGHSHPVFVDGLKNQIEKLIHTSSLYYIENQALLAKTIVESSCADKVFFANSGAEANEGAIKLAKIYFYKQGKAHKNEIISLKNSFHGRTITTIAATGQEKYQKPYQPLTPGFTNIIKNDIELLKSTITENTAAILVELIQGESGVHALDYSYVKELRKLCDESKILLIVDEVQTGMGRTGKLFAYEHYDITPDIFTLAKALGNGVPIGAVCALDFVAAAFSPGDHGTTFGGNPLSTKAGLLVFEIMKSEGLVENAKNMGDYFLSKLNEMKDDKITEVRAKGLMIGIDLAAENAKEIAGKLFSLGYLVGVIGAKTIRLVPPLVITKSDIDSFIDTFISVLN